MLIGYVSDERYAALADVLLEFSNDQGDSWEARSRASGSVHADLPPGDYQVELAPERDERPPFVDLDSRWFKLLPDFEAHFPAGPPSLVECERLVVTGDVLFGRGVVVRGRVTIENEGEGQLRLEDGAVLDGAATAR